MSTTSSNMNIKQRTPTGLLPILKENYISPSRPSWSHSIFVLSLGVLIGLLLSSFIKTDSISQTSLIGFAITTPVFTIFAFLLPSFLIERRVNTDIIGEFTGIGPLMIAFASGVPLSFVFKVIHNFCSYYHLWTGKVTVFPAFFYYCEDISYITRLTELVAGTIIPTVGIALFFYGVLWKQLSGRSFILMALLTAIPFAVVQFNPIDIFSYMFVGAWYALLRDRIGNIGGIILCAISSELTYFLTTKSIPEINIYSTSTFSDIDNTFLYSSLPALIFGCLLLLLVRRYLNYFKDEYFSSTLADNIDVKNQKLNPVLPNIPWFLYIPVLLTGLLILAAIWYFLFKGAFL